MKDKLLRDNVVNNKNILIKILTKCAKMTEEGGDLIRNGGMNGANSNTLPLQQIPKTTTRNSANANISLNTNYHNNHNNLNENHQKDGIEGVSGSSSSSGGGGCGSNSIGGGRNATSSNVTKGKYSTGTENESRNTSASGSGGGGTSGNSGAATNNVTGAGGRLQFFKGKFKINFN